MSRRIPASNPLLEVVSDEPDPEAGSPPENDLTMCD